MVRTWTTAPEAYDGFGTVTVGYTGIDSRGKTLREVETPTAHVTWQRARYGSGMHVGLDSHEWAEYLRYNFVHEGPARPEGLR